MMILIPGIDLFLAVPLVAGSIGAFVLGVINPNAAFLGFSLQQWAVILGILAF